MMKLKKMKNNFLVDWSNDYNIHEFVNRKTNVYNILSTEMHCLGSIGLILGGMSYFLDQEDLNTMWIHSIDCFFDSNHGYIDYLRELYEIFGIFFSTQDEANMFVEIVKKKYTWEQLR